MIKAVIFDVDGTMLDSMPVWESADRAYLCKLGIEFDEAVYNKMHTMTFETSAVYFCRAFNLDITPEQLKADILEELYRRYGDEVAPIPGMPELIKELHERGLRMSVATSNRRDLVTAALTRLGLIGYFERILICDELGTGKHEPTIYIRAAELMNALPCETAVFEDSPHAIKTAKEAGFITIKAPDHDFSDAAVRRELIESL